MPPFGMRLSMGATNSWSHLRLSGRWPRFLRRDFAWRKDRVQVVIRVVAQAARIIVPRSVLSVVTADPDDNRILECAVDGKAQALGLAGVDHPSTGVLVQVHAGRQRQLGGFVAQIHRGGRL